MENITLITGLHRSGTTWFSKSLHLSDSQKIIHEPFNFYNPLIYKDIKKIWYPVLEKKEFEKILYNITHNKLDWRSLVLAANTPGKLLNTFRKFISSSSKATKIILKDPFLSFSLEALCQSKIENIFYLKKDFFDYATSLARANWRLTAEKKEFNINAIINKVSESDAAKKELVRYSKSFFNFSAYSQGLYLKLLEEAYLRNFLESRVIFLNYRSLSKDPKAYLNQVMDCKEAGIDFKEKYKKPIGPHFTDLRNKTQSEIFEEMKNQEMGRDELYFLELIEELHLN